MRVVAGSWKGRRLITGRGRETRPTTDRVKEAVFSILGDRIGGSEVIDLCCGVGSLGIEALSRGADLAHFVDSSPAALALVQKNLDGCGAEADHYRLHRFDALRWLSSYRDQVPTRPVIVLSDPPYASDLVFELAQLLLNLPAAFPLLAAVLEHTGDETWEPVTHGRMGWRRRRYGQSALTILEA